MLIQHQYPVRTAPLGGKFQQDCGYEMRERERNTECNLTLILFGQLFSRGSLYNYMPQKGIETYD